MAKASSAESMHTVQASVVQDNIFRQLRLSRDIFQTIPDLVKLAADRPDDPELARSLEAIIDKLIDVGDHLSESAKDTGGRMLSGPK